MVNILFFNIILLTWILVKSETDMRKEKRLCILKLLPKIVNFVTESVVLELVCKVSCEVT
jgi:hypothetical protein